MARIDTDLLGLQIVALDSATVVGEIDGLLIDDVAVKVAGFLVDLGLYEASVLPFGAAHAVGVDAVIVASADAIAPISANTALEALAEKDVTISDAKAITRSGRSVGTIGDFFVDTDTGDVVGMEFIASDQTVYPREAVVIPASTVYRLGRDIIVLEDDYDRHLLKDDSSLARVAKPRPVEPAPLAAPVAAEEPAEEPAAEEPEVGIEEPAAEEEPAGEPDAEEPAAEEPEVEIEEPAAEEQPEAAEEPAAEEPEVEIEEPVAEEQAEPAKEIEEAFEAITLTETGGAAAAAVAESTQADETGDDTLTSEPVEEPVDEAPALEEPAATEPAEDAFTSQQKHFLIGKRVLRRIETPGGEVIAEEGESVTFEMIQKAKSTDQLLILSLNVE